MRAAVLNELGGRIEVRDVELDRPGPREVRIRTAAAGVCHSDLHMVQGNLPWPMPVVLGHESAGVVLEVGAEVTQVKPGDHVVTCLTAFCGTCSYCLSGRSQLCLKVGLTRSNDAPARLTLDGERLSAFAGIGSFAEELLVHENAVVAISPEVPLTAAALLGCGVTTGVGAALNSAGIRPGERAVVIGCGGIGLNAVQGARIAGAAEIIAVDLSAEKRDMAVKLGATSALDPADGDIIEQVLARTGGVEHALEAIGRPETMSQAFQMLARGGTATIVGVPPAGATLQVPAGLFLHERTIRGSFLGGRSFRELIPAYAGLYLQGQLHLDELIGAHLTLDDVDQTLADFSHATSARQLIVFEDR